LEFLKNKKCWAPEEKQPALLERILRDRSLFENHFLVASTGTSSSELSKVKYIVHEIPNFLKVIDSQIQFFNLDKRDRFLCPLPASHIAYIALKARAERLGAYFEDYTGKWSAAKFAAKMIKESFSFSSLVPTQVFDLVEQNIKGPGIDNHQILVGGAAITDQLLHKAKKLGWCLLRSYGASEFGSACAINKKSDFLKDDFSQSLLPHFEYELSKDSFLKVKGQALFQSYLFFDLQNENFEIKSDLKDENGFFQTEDLVEIDRDSIKVHGRGNRFLIRNGENIFLQELENKISDLLETEVLVLKKAHPRQGEVPVLIFDTKKQDRSLYSQPSDGISSQKFESTRSNETDVMAQICKKLSALPKMQRPAYFSDMPIMKADTGKILYAKMQERLSHDKDLEFFQLDWPQ
tara:strand:+ start:7240 stop:8460 length:1221 start_codon:yes stop_codon:yes gene_type:complete